VSEGRDILLRIFIGILLLISIVACTESAREGSKKDLTQHERDSILAESDLPGANVVGKAIEVSDSSTARSKRIDEQSD
jgi:hypothetical protein